MGAGIAQLLATNGIPVDLKEVNDDLVRAGMTKIEKLTSEAVRKGALTRDRADAALRAITPSTSWQPMAGVDLAIEAVVEVEDVKSDVFRKLAECLGPSAVLASNTSALSIKRLADSTPHPSAWRGCTSSIPFTKCTSWKSSVRRPRMTRPSRFWSNWCANLARHRLSSLIVQAFSSIACSSHTSMKLYG